MPERSGEKSTMLIRKLKVTWIRLLTACFLFLKFGITI